MCERYFVAFVCVIVCGYQGDGGVASAVSSPCSPPPVTLPSDNACVAELQAVSGALRTLFSPTSPVCVLETERAIGVLLLLQENEELRRIVAQLQLQLQQHQQVSDTNTTDMAVQVDSVRLCRLQLEVCITHLCMLPV